MKKTLTFAFLAFLALSSAALADTLVVNSVTHLQDEDPRDKTSSLGMIVMVKTNPTFKFEVAGKTCTFYTSARGSVPGGCNYEVTVAPDGSITGMLVAGNNYCTQTKDIPSSCK